MFKGKREQFADTTDSEKEKTKTKKVVILVTMWAPACCWRLVGTTTLSSEVEDVV